MRRNTKTIYLFKKLFTSDSDDEYDKSLNDILNHFFINYLESNKIIEHLDGNFHKKFEITYFFGNFFIYKNDAFDKSFIRISGKEIKDFNLYVELKTFFKLNIKFKLMIKTFKNKKRFKNDLIEKFISRTNSRFFLHEFDIDEVKKIINLNKL